MKKATVEEVRSPFSAKLFSFLRELRNNNDREWFAENKSLYEQDVLFAAMGFVTQMQPRLAKHSRYLLAEPKRVGGSIMRIYRDTRFGKDKTPYKTNVGIHFRHSIGGDVREWNRVRNNKKLVSRYKLDGESLKTAPRGMDPSHPAIEDLRRKSFAGVTPLSEKAFLQADVCDQIMSAFDDAKPLMKFLCDALQQPY